MTDDGYVAVGLAVSVVVMVVAFFALHWLVRVVRRFSGADLAKRGGEVVSGGYVLRSLAVGGLGYVAAKQFLQWRMPGVEPDFFVVALVSGAFTGVAVWFFGREGEKC